MCGSSWRLIASCRRLLEINTANAVIARRILAHAGVDDRVTVLVGTLGDGGETIRTLRRDCNFTPGSLDLVFLDHPNILVPGAPAYRAHMRDNDGTLWHTTEHRTHAEYQSVIKDVVLESDYLGT
jgi:catechol O-methyltransferase